MNPWDILGWILVGILSLILIAVLIVVIFFTISVSLYLRDKKREIRAAELEELRTSITVPHFETMKPGDIFAVDYANWKILELWHDYDIDRNRHRLRIDAESVAQA